MNEAEERVLRVALSDPERFGNTFRLYGMCYMLLGELILAAKAGMLNNEQAKIGVRVNETVGQFIQSLGTVMSGLEARPNAGHADPEREP